jgi:hypothetical protein
LAIVEAVRLQLLAFVDPIGTQLIAFHHSRLLAVIAVHTKLVAVRHTHLLTVNAIDPKRLPVLMRRSARHAKARPTIGARTGVTVAMALESEGPALTLGAAATLHPEGSPVAAAPAALHPECTPIGSTAAAASLHACMATATAAELGSASVAAATVPAVTAAGLCARRRRNRQGGDAHGKV